MVESGSVMKLTLSQLRSLGKELQLRLPAKIKKEGLKLRIISELKWRENHSDVLRKTNEVGWDSLNRDRDGNVRIKKSTKNRTCLYWVKGNCSRGDECRLRHTTKANGGIKDE